MDLGGDPGKMHWYRHGDRPALLNGSQYGGQWLQAVLGCLVKFSKDCAELDMKNCQLEGQVSTALVATGCGICIHHSYLVQEVLHGWPVIFQEAIHKGHVGFLLTERSTVGEILDDFGDECKGSGWAWGRVLWCQAKEARCQDGRA